MDLIALLHEHGLKATPPRVTLLRCLFSLSSPTSAEGIYELLKEEGMDLSTLYRNLNALTKASLVLKEVGPSKENLYSLCQEGERHLLVCLRCGKKMPLEGCPYEEANEGIYEKTGFVVLEHKTEIYGVCPKCAHGEKPHHHN